VSCLFDQLHIYIYIYMGVCVCVYTALVVRGGLLFWGWYISCFTYSLCPALYTSLSLPLSLCLCVCVSLFPFILCASLHLSLFHSCLSLSLSVPRLINFFFGLFWFVLVCFGSGDGWRNSGRELEQRMDLRLQNEEEEA